MPINFTCANSNCAKRLRVRDELGGKRIRCPACGDLLEVPARQRGLRPAAPPSAGQQQHEARG